MKILKKAKILPCECKRCYAVFQPKIRHTYQSKYTDNLYVNCPMCKYQNKVYFEKGADNEQREADS